MEGEGWGSIKQEQWGSCGTQIRTSTVEVLSWNPISIKKKTSSFTILVIGVSGHNRVSMPMDQDNHGLDFQGNDNIGFFLFWEKGNSAAHKLEFEETFGIIIQTITG